MIRGKAKAAVPESGPGFAEYVMCSLFPDNYTWGDPAGLDALSAVSNPTGKQDASAMISLFMNNQPEVERLTGLYRSTLGKAQGDQGATSPGYDPPAEEDIPF